MIKQLFYKIHVSIKDLEDLLDRYNKLRSFANDGSYDNWAISRWKLDKLLRLLHLQKMTDFTYDLPFAFNPIRNEIRNTLIRISNLYKINYLRKGKPDDESDQAIQMIKKYLETIPKCNSFIVRLRDNIFSLLGIAIGILALIQASNPGDLQIALIGLAILFIAPSIAFLVTKISDFFLQRNWYKKWIGKLDIHPLKNKIISELIVLNDNTFQEFEDRYKN
jgi:hypothetical protein